MGDGRGNGRNPFQVQETPPASNDTKPDLSFRDIMHNAPARRDAPAPAQPGVLTQDAYVADQSAAQTFQQYAQLSENGTKPVSADLWRTLSGRFDAALTASKTVTPQMLEAFQGQAALDLQRAIPNEQQQTQALTRFNVVQGNMARALQGLTPEQRVRVQEIETQFTQDVQRLQQQHAANPQMFNQELIARANRMIADQKANNSALGEAMEAQMNFMNSPEGQAAQRFSATMQDVERLRNSPATIQFLYAQALDKQGGADNQRKAGELLKDAVKSPQVAALIDSSLEAQQLALKYDVKTPNMVLALEDIGKKFPELVEAQKALDMINDPAKNTRENFSKICGHFETALAMTDREGPDAIKVEDIRAQAKALDEKVKAAGAGADPKDVEQLQTMIKKIENITLIRFQYAQYLNKFGHDNNDADAKAKSVAVLEGIQTTDSSTFAGSPEIQGALNQARAGRPINVSAAVSEIYTLDAANVARAGSTGIVDGFLPGATPALSIATRPFGVSPSDIPYAGPVMFGDQKKHDQAAVQRLAMAYLNNADATQAQVDQQVGQNRSALREYGSDAAAIGAGFGTRYLTQGLMRGPWYAKALGFGLQLTAAGATKDFLADGEMLTGRDWLRGSGMYGLSLGAYRMVTLNPGNAAISAETAGGLGTRYGVTGLGGTASEVSAQLAAQNGSVWARIGQRLNPLTYSGYQPGAGWVGFGGERTFAAVANGSMSLAQANARLGVGSFFNTFGAGAMLNAGREGLYIATGKTDQMGNPYTFQGALYQMGGAGLQGGFTASLAMPFARAMVRGLPGGSHVLDGSSSLLARVSPAAPTIAREAIYLGGAPGLAALADYNQAGKLEELAARARQLARETEEKARQDLQAQQQPRR